MNLNDAARTRHARLRHRPNLVYAFVALLWGFASISALSQSRTATGTACPPGWEWRPSILGAQILACFIDAVLLVNMRDLRKTEVYEGIDVPGFLAPTLVASASLTFLVAFPTLLYDSKLSWTFTPSWSDLADLTVDSLLIAMAVLCGFSFLHLIHPTTMALIISTLYLFGYHVPVAGAGIFLNTSLTYGPLATHIIVAILIGTLACLTLRSSKHCQQSTIKFTHQWVAIAFVGIYSLSLIASGTLISPSRLSLSEVVEELTAAANSASRNWEEQAATSQTLSEAVDEYKRRYGLPPPPNFDKWYTFATDNNSPIIDDFRQIYEDLLPFWGIEPAIIRDRTAHLLDYSNLKMGGLRIRKGVIELSPHTSGTHRWMLDSMQRMIGPFAQWLPDMDIALNLDDECRMAIPFEEMRGHRAVAHKVIHNMMHSSQKMQNSTTTKLNGPQWPPSFKEPLPGTIESRYFSNNIRKQLYYDLIAPSCPPLSPARRKRWWDRSTLCVECLRRHSVITDRGAILTDVGLANDLCHQPDIAYLNGFVMSSAAMVGTSTLFPIFSQGRMGGFSDIMIPSPWNFDQKSPYVEEDDHAWDDKHNSLFWRGSASDGYAADGSWTGFLRTRFVHEAYQRNTKLTINQNVSSPNVSFAGSMSKCHDADCAAELHTFHSWANGLQAVTPGEQKTREKKDNYDDTSSLLSQVTPFEENWRFRHLIDMDGAGFSGRFLPFLASRSLIYRAALFQSWFDERLSPWYHYVPVDVRLGSGFWALFDFFSSKKNLKQTGGNDHARNIAAQGRAWAQKALRPEDMQIYMFRLLLEWGRITDDNREQLDK